MLVHRIALLAARLGIPLPSIAGNARLGLAGTIRVTTPVPLIFLANARNLLGSLDASLDPESLVRLMQSTPVWMWCEASEPELVAASRGEYPEGDFTLVFSSPRCALRCVADRDGGLRVINVSRIARRAPGARLLVGRCCIGPVPDFDPRGLCQLVASQRQIAVHANSAELKRDEDEEREFMSGARRYLEALREHAITSRPRARYELAGLDPLRIRVVEADVWAPAFLRPETLVELPTATGEVRLFAVIDVTDDGDVLTLDGTVDPGTIAERDEVTVRANDDSLKRMREALDTIAMGVDPAHGRLLAALTRPAMLDELENATPEDSSETARQEQAIALAIGTPDIALIHGPPGTGKTTVISRIVEQLVRDGKRVLLVAPTHVALDNVLERVGDCEGVTAIRLGVEDNVDVQARRFLIPHRRADLSQRLQGELAAAVERAPTGPVADVQREWARRIAGDEEVGALLLLNANLVCATPIGIAMAREFRAVEVVFDVMILDEASKATITDFLVPAARARKWILVGDAKQLAPYVDLDDLAAVISKRIEQAGLETTPEDWAYELATQLRRHFDERMHPSQERRDAAWRRLVAALAFASSDGALGPLLALGLDPARWRAQQQRLEPFPPNLLRLGAELLEIQALALPSVFEHLSRLPKSRAVRLNYQHRMAPSLAAFSSELVYEGDYPSAADTASLGLAIPSLEPPAIWLDTAYAPQGRRYEYPRDRDWSGGDYTNPLEVEVARELIEVCARWAARSWRGDPRPHGRGEAATFELGVICFYREQARVVRDAIFERLGRGSDPWRRRWNAPAANGAPIDIHVSIVDRFQGREKDVIVLCTTRSNPVGRRGHVDNLNRLNVAVTRARHKRIVIGDSATLAGERRPTTDLLRRLYDTSERKLKWGRALGGGRR